MAPYLRFRDEYIFLEVQLHCMPGYNEQRRNHRSGGGGGSESMDGWGCAILALEVVTKNLIFA